MSGLPPPDYTVNEVGPLQPVQACIREAHYGLKRMSDNAAALLPALASCGPPPTAAAAQPSLPSPSLDRPASG